MLSCEIFKNSYFEKQLWKAASKIYLKRDSNKVVGEAMINYEKEFTRLFNAVKLWKSGGNSIVKLQ